MSFIRKQPENTTPKDVNSSQLNSGRHGNTGDQFRKGEYATVLRYNSDRHSATVRTERGRTINGVPRLRSTPGEVAPLSTGTEVLISYEYGNPIIMGIMTIPASDNQDTTKYSVTEEEGFGGQGTNKSTITTGGNYRQAQEPTDMMPGDWGYVGENGNLISVLNGGVNVLKSSPLSQIRTYQVNDLVELISRNYRHISDMGEFSIFNDDGRINMRFRGASDQRSEAGPDEENWTIRFDLGSEGDMLNFELTTPKGQTLFRLHVDSEGAAEIYGINGVAINSGTRTGGSHAEEHTGDSNSTIKGNRVASVKGDVTDSTGGNLKREVGSDYQTNVNNDYRVQALRDLSLGCGRNMSVAVQGGEGDNALTYDIEDGNWTVELGSATAPDSGFSMSTFSGDVSFSSTLGGSFIVDSALGNLSTKTKEAKINTQSFPDSVVLGGDRLQSHLVKFEQLQSHLIQLYRALDRHTHQIPSTASAGGASVTGTTGTPVVPIGSPIVGDIQKFKSITSGVSS